MSSANPTNDTVRANILAARDKAPLKTYHLAFNYSKTAKDAMDAIGLLTWSSSDVTAACVADMNQADDKVQVLHSTLATAIDMAEKKITESAGGVWPRDQVPFEARQ